MKPRRRQAILRGAAFLSTLASSAIGIFFLVIAPGMPLWLQLLFLIPILSAPALVALLAWRPTRTQVRENRMALREKRSGALVPQGGLAEEESTIVLIKQKRSRRY